MRGKVKLAAVGKIMEVLVVELVTAVHGSRVAVVEIAVVIYI